MTWTLHHGDCLDVLRSLDADSIDACVTDPPYGLEFMQKAWDAPWKSAITRTGYGDAERLPRPSHSSTRNPVCLNCHRHRRGKDGCHCDAPRFDETPADSMRLFQAWCEEWAAEVHRVLKPGGHLLAFGGTRTYHRLACAIEDAGFEVRDSLHWIFGSGFPKSLNVGDGRGTALKPAHEPCVVARKPLVGTVAANVARYGTGALNVDGCRVGFQSEADFMSAAPGGVATSKKQHVGAEPDAGNAEARVAFKPKIDRRAPSGRIGEASAERRYAGAGGTNFAALPGPRGGDPSGRWPPNILLDREAAAALDAQSGEAGACARATSPNGVGTHPNGIYSPAKGRTDDAPFYGDTGGASRFFPTFDADPFFYEAKASRSERERGLEGLARRQRDDSRDADAPGANNPRNRGGQLRTNTHPTVKPVELMRWLCRLVTPPGGLVLDPFTGSGTTGIAALREGFRFVGIEREAEYVAIARRRIEEDRPLFNRRGA